MIEAASKGFWTPQFGMERNNAAMKAVTVSVVGSFAPPPEGAELVLFSDTKNYVAQYDSEKMLAKAVRYAKHYGVYLVPDRFVTEDSLCLCLIGPDGSPLLGQKAIHLNLDYRGFFRRESRLETAVTPFGRVALLVDVDINFPQVIRAAAAEGVQLIVSSQFIQLFDFFDARIEYGPIAAAKSNAISVAAVTSAGSVLVGPDGGVIAGFSEDLPLTAKIPIGSPSGWEDVGAGGRLLRTHGMLIRD